jgi:hypothetical protein
MPRRPTTPAQVELPVTLVALAAALGALFQALLSLLLARLRAGPPTTERVRVLRWVALGMAVAAGGVALAAGLTA